MWKPIATAPLDGTRVLVWNAMTGPYTSEHKDGEWPLRLWGGRRGDWYPRPTHWMPLPEFPPPEHPESMTEAEHNSMMRELGRIAWAEQFGYTHHGYIVDGCHFYFPDFPQEEWRKHESVVAVFGDGKNLAEIAPVPYTITEAGLAMLKGGA